MQSKQQQNLTELKTKIKSAELPALTKELNKEIKKRKDIKRTISVVDEAQKNQLRSYLEVVKDKIDLILQAITEDKINKAGLAQLAKAFRSLASEFTRAHGDEIKKIEQKSLNINIDIKNMSPTELLEFLSKKSQEHD